MLTVRAPAKLNLTLEVLAKRPDGFHEIRSVAQTIGLYDSLHFKQGQGLEFRCDKRDWLADWSLVSKAANLLKVTTGCSSGAIIEIDKRIPMIAGLGGDSSGAAAALRGLNRLWRLGLSPAELVSLALRLGSDVPFFFYGGTALLEGRGELVAPLPPLPRMWVVLVVPPVSRTLGKTARLYASLESTRYTSGQVTERLVALLTAGGGVSIPLFNAFDYVAFANFPGLEGYWERFMQAGAREVHLVGSGPTLFALLEDKSWAEQIYQCLQQDGLESYLTETVTTVGERD